MECGLVGLPGSGKTTLFNALTGGHAEAFSERAHVGVAPMPDSRLEVIASFIPTKKIIPATVQLVDIRGAAPGTDARKINTFLENVRQVEAICQVVRCFDRETAEPEPEIQDMDTELILADLVVVESARDRAARVARTGDADARARVEVLEKVAPILEDGRPVRSLERPTDAERAILTAHGLVTAKPVLYVANVDEDDLDGTSDAAAAVRRHAEAAGAPVIVVCAKLEAELAELEEADRTEMLLSMGLAEPAIGPMARALNSLLGLTTFYTAGPKQVRAWSIPLGATAPEAAGSVHTDMQRGFIRAECYHVDELVEYKNEKAIREAGRMRIEGKHYHLQDGDVVHFLFNV